jgi:hypothetical protein
MCKHANNRKRVQADGINCERRQNIKFRGVRMLCWGEMWKHYWSNTPMKSVCMNYRVGAPSCTRDS